MKPVKFHEHSFKQFSDWVADNKKTFDKICKLVKSINSTPFKGEGKPEPLKHSKQGYWSRRIDKKNRLVYKVSDDEITIVSCKGHYDDG